MVSPYRGLSKKLPGVTEGTPLYLHLTEILSDEKIGANGSFTTAFFNCEWDQGTFAKSNFLQATKDYNKRRYHVDMSPVWWANSRWNSSILDSEFYALNHDHMLMDRKNNKTGKSDGNLLTPATLPYLKTHFAKEGGVQLYTSHGLFKAEKATADAIKTEDACDISLNDESKNAPLLYAQIVAAFISLEEKGTMIIRVRGTFCSKFSRSLLALTAYLFQKTFITKPLTSCLYSNEYYLVGKSFLKKKLTSELEMLILGLTKVNGIENVTKKAMTPTLLKEGSFKETDKCLLNIGTQLFVESECLYMDLVSGMLMTNWSMEEIRLRTTPIFKKLKEQWITDHMTNSVLPAAIPLAPAPAALAPALLAPAALAPAALAPAATQLAAAAAQFATAATVIATEGITTTDVNTITTPEVVTTTVESSSPSLVEKALSNKNKPILTTIATLGEELSKEAVEEEKEKETVKKVSFDIKS